MRICFKGRTEHVDDGKAARLGASERVFEALEALSVLPLHHAGHLTQRHCTQRSNKQRCVLILSVIKQNQKLLRQPGSGLPGLSADTKFTFEVKFKVGAR